MSGWGRSLDRPALEDRVELGDLATQTAADLVAQLEHAVVGACPASLILGRLFGLRPSLYSRKELVSR